MTWIVIGAIIAAFLLFAVVLEWAERTTNAHRRPRPVPRESQPQGKLQVS